MFKVGIHAFMCHVKRVKCDAPEILRSIMIYDTVLQYVMQARARVHITHLFPSSLTGSCVARPGFKGRP